MKQKIGIAIFLTVGFFLLYLLFTNESDMLAEDFADWIDAIANY